MATFSSKLGVARSVDLPHPAFTDRLENVVVSDLVTSWK